ncbi:MAG: hypothetical protein HC890_13595 [Chloroflexaceae bacterium]|nr:hypothetical protein [Chloroflexaceae bacterium]
MQDWEFWLQKPGDSWLPLKNSTFLLQAGRYRLAAHSIRPNLTVEIRLSYQAALQTAGSLVQSCQRRTNKHGFVLIAPFTELRAGWWEVRCCSDIFSEMLGEFWQETLHLEVLAAVKPEVSARPLVQPSVTAAVPSAITVAGLLQTLPQAIALRALAKPIAEPNPASRVTAAETVPETPLIRLKLFEPTQHAHRIMRSQPGSNQILPPRVKPSTAKPSSKQPQLPRIDELCRGKPVSLKPVLTAEERAIDAAFAALNSHERFWSRLNSFTLLNSPSAATAPTLEPAAAP